MGPLKLHNLYYTVPYYTILQCNIPTIVRMDISITICALIGMTIYGPEIQLKLTEMVQIMSWIPNFSTKVSASNTTSTTNNDSHHPAAV